MHKNIFAVHTHHIASHFTNALWPFAFILFASYLLTGKGSYESASFYCMIVAMIGGPFTLISGVVDWKTRFQGRPTRIFNHKRIFGVLYVVISIIAVLWRAVDPTIAHSDNGLMPVYGLMLFANTGFVAYLGHLGGKFI